MGSDYPGAAQHQALLQAIVAHYENDPRIRAVIVFGSLGRGDWDAYSDIDLDLVITDDAKIDAIEELRRLCESFVTIGEKVALIIPDGDDAGDVLLESLLQLSVRYHPLALTHPNIVSSMKVLAGTLGHATIAAAGEANRKPIHPPLDQLLDACVRDAAVAHVYLQREQLWGAVEMLHHIRGLLMQIFARTHGQTRAYQAFTAEADEQLQLRLGATLPQYDLHSVWEALEKLLDVMQIDLHQLSNGQLHLSAAHQHVLNQIRK